MRHALFEAVKKGLAERMEEVLTDLLPGGAVRGKEYVCGSLAGEAGESCRTRIETGVGADFTTGEKWGDIISLAAQVWKTSPLEACGRLAKQYNINGVEMHTNAIAQNNDAEKHGEVNAGIAFIMPVPESAPPPFEG